MKLQALQEACRALNYSPEEAKAYLYEGRFDFRNMNISLSYAHFPILLYAALLAGGVENDAIVPLTLSQGNIIQFTAPIMQSVMKNQPPALDEIKTAVIDNKIFNNRISAFLESKDEEDFVAVAVSDKQYQNASHGMRIHLKKLGNKFTIQILDSAVGEGKLGEETASESMNYLWLSAYLKERIKSHRPYVEITMSAKASSPQQAHLCYDHTAFELAAYVLKKMGKHGYFKIPENNKQGSKIALREKLFECHEIKAELSLKIRPLVDYIQKFIIQRAPSRQVSDLKAQKDDLEFAQKLAKQFAQENQKIKNEHNELNRTMMAQATNPHRILSQNNRYQSLKEINEPLPNKSCCCIIL